jgi:hypothetical protein
MRIGFKMPDHWQKGYNDKEMSYKADVIRAEFHLSGWRRDNFDRMVKGDLMISFVFNEAVLKRKIGDRWFTLERTPIERLFNQVNHEKKSS